MDTISRESNTSILPIVAIIAGLVGLILGGVALAKASSAKTETIALVAFKDEYSSRVASIENQVPALASGVEKAQKKADQNEREANNAFGAVASEIGSIRGEIAALKESATKPKAAAANGKGPKEPVVAGPGEYIVKQGDNSGTKIAKANGVSIQDLIAVNPNVNWSKLKIGDKLKLPKK